MVNAAFFIGWLFPHHVMLLGQTVCGRTWLVSFHLFSRPTFRVGSRNVPWRIGVYWVLFVCVDRTRTIHPIAGNSFIQKPFVNQGFGLGIFHITLNRLLRFSGGSHQIGEPCGSLLFWPPTYEDVPIWCLTDLSIKYTRLPVSIAFNYDTVFQALGVLT